MRMWRNLTQLMPAMRSAHGRTRWSCLQRGGFFTHPRGRPVVGLVLTATPVHAEAPAVPADDRPRLNDGKGAGPSQATDGGTGPGTRGRRVVWEGAAA